MSEHVNISRTSWNFGTVRIPMEASIENDFPIESSSTKVEFSTEIFMD